jgi:hypothetical protein
MSILETVQKYGTYREIAPGEYAGPCPECKGAMRFRVLVAENVGKCLSCTCVLTVEAGASAGVQFNAQKMQQLITDTYSRVFSECPKGASSWLEENRPDITEHLIAVGVAVDAAFAAEDEADLFSKLATWEKYHLAAWQRYNERPEVMERQEAMF